MPMLLDSGAFSAWTKKLEINIDEYISFYFDHAKYIDYIVNLDVIPGEWGRAATKKEAEIACQKGFENYYYMLDKGVPHKKLLHVFHQGDDYSYLLKMMDECTDYIGVSPANDRTTRQKMDWLDITYKDYICDKKGMPKIRTHGLGVTAIDILLKYPFYSADSTTWVLMGRFGDILIPFNTNGKPDYHKIPLKITFSNRPSKPDKYNYNNGMTSMLKRYVDEYLDKHQLPLGVSSFDDDGKETVIEPGLTNSYKTRDQANIIFFLGMEESLPTYPWAFKLEQRVNRFSL